MKKTKRKPKPRPLTPAEMGRRSRALMTKKERSAAASKAAIARWSRVPGTPSSAVPVAP